MLDIKVIGSGCSNCIKLYDLCREVLSENNLEGSVDKVTDLEEITESGIFFTPGLMVNNKILSQGKIPTKSTLLHWMEEAGGK